MEPIRITPHDVSRASRSLTIRRARPRRVTASSFAVMTLSSMALLACGDDDVAVDAHVPSLDGGVDVGPPTRDAGPPLEPLDRPPLPAANAVALEDPRYPGMIRFLWDTWDVEVRDQWPPAEFMLSLMADDEFGDQFENFGFLRDPNDEFPVGFKRGTSDPTRVHETCALCHVGELPDERVWLGAPNRRLDFGGFRVAVHRRWVAAGNPPLLTELEIEKAERLGPGRTGAETGAFPEVIPVDFPTYFSLGTRGRLNYLGTSRDVRSEAYLGIYVFGAGYPNDDEALVPFPSEARTAEFLAFFSEMAAPTGPPQDPTRVARGRELFVSEGCESCHRDDSTQLGVTPYASDGVERLPSEEHPRGAIATSRGHRILIDGDGEGGMEDDRSDIITFVLRRRLAVGPSDGYRAADLRGIWSSPPYLHNGSVPTLEDLLRPPAERPTTFERDGFLVDTSRLHEGNEGHDFGTDLSDDDRAALVAYLRTL
jgi:hypothetical protein